MTIDRIIVFTRNVNLHASRIHQFVDYFVVLSNADVHVLTTCMSFVTQLAYGICLRFPFFGVGESLT